MKDIKDYLHLYIGCEVQCASGSSDYEYEGCIAINSPLLLGKHSNGNWKLLLRPLSDMTEEEAREYFSVCSLKPGDYIGAGPDWIPISARSTHWLLSKGFDLFDLIPAGLAIDKTLED